MTNLEEGVRNTLERLENKYKELEEKLQKSNERDNFKVGYQFGLDLAISFLKTDLLCWGEEDANK